MKKRKLLQRNIILILALFLSGSMLAQNVPVNMHVLSDYYRRAQLLGEVNPDISFCSLPFFPEKALKIHDSIDPDSTLRKNTFSKYTGTRSLGENGYIRLMPVTWTQQFNTHHPEGIDNGTMIPSRGYQTLFSAGVYLKYGPLSIQLMPEIDYANNTPYAGFPVAYGDARWAQYYAGVLNYIDLPERFGTGSYHKMNWGQSSIRLTFGAISIGLSNENLWWGPGLRNDLIMTDNAPGFKHLTFNTVRPVKTFLGSFEWQLIAGRLVPSGLLPPGTDKTYNGKQLYVAKPYHMQYLSGLLVAWHPKWVPGLFLGFARTVQQYNNNVGVNLTDWFPVFTPLGLKAAGGDAKMALKQQQLYSVFGRWLWKKAHGEIYFEYGRNGYFWDKRDFKVEMAYTGAFVLGFRKLIPLKLHKGEYIQAMMEFTQLAENSTTRNRGGMSWYQSSVIRQGYTNEGQLLGAGIGPGSNMQTLEVDWIKSLKSIGLRVERYAHNNDFFNTYILDVRRNWVDMGVSLLGSWPYKNLLFSGQLEWVKSLNYEWQFTPPPPPAHWGPGLDVTNYHLSLGVTYRF